MSSPARSPAEVTREVVERAFREETGRVLATLIRILGDFDLAEEAVQDAFLVALVRWPSDGACRRAHHSDERMPPKIDSRRGFTIGDQARRC